MSRRELLCNKNYVAYMHMQNVCHIENRYVLYGTYILFLPGMVMDDEKAFEVIESNLPRVRRLLCWNHIISCAKLWLRQHGATSTEVPVYISDIRDLLHQQSTSEYVCQLESLRKKWSEPFYIYYMKELDNKVSFYYSNSSYCNVFDF